MDFQSGRQKKLHILFITKWYPNRYDPQLGVFIQKHALAVAKHCQVTVLNVISDELMKDEKKNQELIVNQQQELTSVLVYHKRFHSSVSFVDKIMNAFRYWKATSAGLKYIRKNISDHDITHAYILLRPACVAWFIQLVRNKPFIISEQWSGYATGKYGEKNLFNKILTRFVIRKSKAVTVVSEFLKTHMLRYGLKGNYTVISNVVDFRNPDIKTRTDQKIKMLVVADLVDEIKNVSGVLKAVAEIVSLAGNFELHIIGDGIDKMKLEALASQLNLLNQCVFFHGMKPNDVVYDFILESDFLVMNSNFETFSSICAEALACGKPVVATRCGGPQEFITDETGILIEPGNHRELVQAIQQMLNGYQHYDQNKLMSYARNHFAAEVISKKFFQVYQTILQ